MALKAAIWTHGHTVEPARPGAWLNAARPEWGAEFKTGGGSHWFLFPFTAPVILDNQWLKLGQAFVMFDARNGAAIKALHIWDGPKNVFKADGLSLSGDHSLGLDNQNVWVIDPPIEMKFGLLYSILVQFNAGGPDIPSILFTSAGADFS